MKTVKFYFPKFKMFLIPSCFIVGIFLFFFMVTEVFAQEPQFLFKWGSFGAAEGQFNKPIGIAIDRTGNVYTTEGDPSIPDRGNNRVQKFTSDGTFITKWGSFGRGDGQFYLPFGIVADTFNNIYIADFNNHRIQKFTSEGIFITKWGSSGAGDGKFLGPIDIAVDSSNVIYVADSANHRIQKFTSTGTFITKWGSFGAGDGQLNFPRSVAVDSRGNIYVGDSENRRIQKFTDEGVFITKWSMPTGQVPRGIAVDQSGNIYVVDADSSRILKFTDNGTLISIWGSRGSADGQFNRPIDVAIDLSDNIYITDMNNNRIQVFGILQSPTLSNLRQLKSDGVTVISENSTTTESAVVFKAIMSSPINEQVKFQVELKPSSQPFDGTNPIESPFVFFGSEATTTEYGLIDGQYHWRARAVDGNGNTSRWQEFAVAGNVDFAVKQVPLYTQRISPHPSEAETTTWALTDYAEGAAGNYDCGSTITDCGCAITSAVMLLRYYGITKGADGQDITPGNINAWLNAHQGYIKGNIKWPKVWEYSTHPQNAVRLQFDGAVNFKDTATLDQYVQVLKPEILYNHSFGHFLVADGTLSTTHTIKDPAFYNTKYLAATGTAPFVRNYNNHFDGLRLFSTSTADVAGIYLSVASPAELLVTDSDGRRSGKDPVTGIVYDEIPGGSYFQEGLSNDVLETPTPPKEAKHLWIPQPLSGQYSVRVIGTGSGSYVFDSLAYDAQGQSHTQTFIGNTQSGLVSEYNLNFTPQQPESIFVQLTSERIDECLTIDGDAGNSGCPAKIEFLSLERIVNSAGVPELVGPGGAVRYITPVVEGQRGTTEVSAKLYNETALLNLLGNSRRIPLDQLCAVFDDQTKDAALASRLIKKTDTEGKYFFGVPSATTTYALIESVRETIAGQMKRVCVLETIFPRHFDSVTNIAFRKVNKVVTTTRETRTGEILVKKQAGHTSQTLSAGESLWSLVKNILGDDSPAKIYIAAKRAAELNSIAIPEWGLYGGQFDAKNLRAGLIINASLFEE